MVSCPLGLLSCPYTSYLEMKIAPNQVNIGIFIVRILRALYGHQANKRYPIKLKLAGPRF